MARCDQGYLCDVCGEEVESIRESDLYLRFVTGELSSNELLARPNAICVAILSYRSSSRTRILYPSLSTVISIGDCLIPLISLTVKRC